MGAWHQPPGTGTTQGRCKFTVSNRCRMRSAAGNSVMAMQLISLQRVLGV
jgi:hypothetical protein